MSNNPSPDLLVAIDLGTTYTGVGWARPQAENSLQTPIQIIQHWPGSSTRHEQKVPTVLVYNKDMHTHLSSWGFLCEEDDGPEKKAYKLFKIFLDKVTLDEAHQHQIPDALQSTTEAERLVQSYLEQIYAHLKSTIEEQTGGIDWSNLAVEFIFSVPTTWRSLEIINAYKGIIEKAGFGRESTRHTATIELTESEAAAVTTIKRRNIIFQKDDVFLSVDAGGGTTDFALMQVIEPGEPFPTLSQLTQVDGVGIGATLIDQAFRILVHQRLARFPDLVAQLPPNCVEHLAKNQKFLSLKHKFGEKVYDAPIYRLPIEGVGYTFNYPEAGIQEGRIAFTREEIQSLFDPHIHLIVEKIREQFDWLQRGYPNIEVKYMFLSGGLGSSTYVRDEILRKIMSPPPPGAPQITIVQDPEPQLVVVKGLLLDRLQRLASGVKSVLATRKARASYGVMCKVPYIPAVHNDVEVQKDEIDGRLYAMGRVNWLIKKGDIVDPEKPIISEFKQKIDIGSSKRQWDCQILISHNDREFLPQSTQDPNMKKLCNVHSNLSSVKNSELVLRKQARSCFGSKKWYECTFEVRAIVAPADLRFELWFAGCKLSRDHQAITVTWDEAGTKLNG